MTRRHPANERAKTRYLAYLKEACGFSEPSLDQVAAAIDRYSDYTRHADFKAFHTDKVAAFKRHLSEQLSVRKQERLSHSTIYATLNALKDFFQWLAGQKGYRKRFSFGDWNYFNPSGETVAVAKAQRPSRAPALDEIRRVIRAMPAGTEIERRDRAVIACVIVTGARCSAVASFRLGHLDIEQRVILQDARTVKTKFRKTFETWFFPVGDDLERILIDWTMSLKAKGWGPDDPLFPSTNVALTGSRQFAPEGLARTPWKSTSPIRTIFREAFERISLPYPNPHAFRETLAALGREVCTTLAEMQAWAQNLGHESMTTTFGSYGKVSRDRQAELVRNAGRTRTASNDKMDQVIALLKNAIPQGLGIPERRPSQDRRRT